MTLMFKMTFTSHSTFIDDKMVWRKSSCNLPYYIRWNDANCAVIWRKL